MPEKNIIEQIEAAGLPDSLMKELKTLQRGLEALLPRLDTVRGRRSRRMLGFLIEEVIDPKVETHWWEALLDLLDKAAAGQGEVGGLVKDAISRLHPLLVERMNSYGEVSLREINQDTCFGVCMLSDTLNEPRSNFVAPNVYSLAQAHFNPHAWFRAIYAGKAGVGFLMMVDNPDEAEYFLWRFMIGGPFQGRGYGRGAIERLVDYVRTRPGAKELLVSCGEGEGSPKEFYQKQGFIPTGELLGDEIVLRLEL